jgi:hypothetical protein
MRKNVDAGRCLAAERENKEIQSSLFRESESRVEFVDVLDELDLLLARRVEVLSQASEVAIEQPLPCRTSAAIIGIVEYSLGLSQISLCSRNTVRRRHGIRA